MKSRGKYVRPVFAEAFQVEFSEADKASAQKYIPTTAHGSTIRYQDGEFSVLIHLGDKEQHAKEGDWVVTEETGKKFIMSDEEFEENYEQSDNVGFDEEDEEEEGDFTLAPAKLDSKDQHPGGPVNKPIPPVPVEPPGEASTNPPAEEEPLPGHETAAE